MADPHFLRERITQLRLAKGVAEYQMGYGLGHSRSYVYNISSGCPHGGIFTDLRVFPNRPCSVFQPRAGALSHRGGRPGGTGRPQRERRSLGARPHPPPAGEKGNIRAEKGPWLSENSRGPFLCDIFSRSSRPVWLRTVAPPPTPLWGSPTCL